MRAGTGTALARVVKGFGSARPHHAYLFAENARIGLQHNAGLGGAAVVTLYGAVYDSVR